MLTFQASIRIASDIQSVMTAFWNLEEWPAVAPHVVAIDMAYSDDQVQVLHMRVRSRGRTDMFRSVRIRQGNSIFFYQPAPPRFLRKHYGWWDLSREGEQTIIVSHHEVDIDIEAASQYLSETGTSPADPSDVRVQMVELIRNNSLQTMQGLKRRMEDHSEVVHA